MTFMKIPLCECWRRSIELGLRFQIIVYAFGLLNIAISVSSPPEPARFRSVQGQAREVGSNVQFDLALSIRAETTIMTYANCCRVTFQSFWLE